MSQLIHQPDPIGFGCSCVGDFEDGCGAGVHDVGDGLGSPRGMAVVANDLAAVVVI